MESNFRVNVTTGTFVRGAIIGALPLMLYYLRDIALVIMTSVVIASVIKPATRWFVKKKIPRTLSVLTVYVSVVGIFTVLFYGLVPPILNDAASFVGKVPQYIESNSTALVGQFLPPDFSFSGLSEHFSIKEIFGAATETLRGYAEGSAGVVGTLFGGLHSLVIIVVLSFYFGVQEDDAGEFFVRGLASRRFG